MEDDRKESDDSYVSICSEKIFDVRDVIESYMQNEKALHNGITGNTEKLYNQSKHRGRK